ncbi:hypothetical protein [Desulfobacula sp.]
MKKILLKPNLLVGETPEKAVTPELNTVTAWVVRIKLSVVLFLEKINRINGAVSHRLENTRPSPTIRSLL